MSKIEEVVIVGGGPAGAYCAYELAQKGISATIFDHSHPREKPCGGGVSEAVVQQFPLVERFRSMGKNSTEFKVILFNDKELKANRSKTSFSISRERFDREILNLAIEEGAKWERERVLRIENEGEIWRIRTSKRLFSTKIIVGADGVCSLVRRHTIGAISTENLALTYGYFVENTEVDSTIIKFLGEIPGYMWFFPRKNDCSLGIGSELRYGSMFKELLDKFVHTHCPSSKVISRFAAMLPSASDPNFFDTPCSGKNWIIIGDAAGHVDPVTGGGIRYAFWSGKLAAEAIAANDLKSYDNCWREEYGKDLQKRCMEKDTFYDPVRLTLSFIYGAANKTYLW